MCVNPRCFVTADNDADAIRVVLLEVAIMDCGWSMSGINDPIDAATIVKAAEAILRS